MWEHCARHPEYFYTRQKAAVSRIIAVHYVRSGKHFILQTNSKQATVPNTYASTAIIFIETELYRRLLQSINCYPRKQLGSPQAMRQELNQPAVKWEIQSSEMASIYYTWSERVDGFWAPLRLFLFSFSRLPPFVCLIYDDTIFLITG